MVFALKKRLDKIGMSYYDVVLLLRQMKKDAHAEELLRVISYGSMSRELKSALRVADRLISVMEDEFEAGDK